MLIVTDDLLTVNEFSRGGKERPELKAIVIHWTANPDSTVKGDRDFYENRKNGKDGYGSAHFIVQGEKIIRCIPEKEIAYHCGTSKIDPASGKIYTDYAREKFGSFAIDHVNSSPNSVSIGIEMHPEDWEGNFSNLTLNKAIELAADLCNKYKLDPLEDLCTHNMIVGWKNCPKLFVDKPELFIKFKNSVKELMT